MTDRSRRASPEPGVRPRAEVNPSTALLIAAIGTLGNQPGYESLPRHIEEAIDWVAQLRPTTFQGVSETVKRDLRELFQRSEKAGLR